MLGDGCCCLSDGLYELPKLYVILALYFASMLVEIGIIVSCLDSILKLLDYRFRIEAIWASRTNRTSDVKPKVYSLSAS